jgi:hypothetical protein
MGVLFKKLSAWNETERVHATLVRRTSGAMTEYVMFLGARQGELGLERERLRVVKNSRPALQSRADPLQNSPGYRLRR